MTADDILDREIGRLEGYLEDRKLPFLQGGGAGQSYVFLPT